jgi:hypothetical protein
LVTGGSIWLKNWAEQNDKAGGNPDAGRYIAIYFAFGIGSVLLVVLQTLILWIFCSIEVRVPQFPLLFSSFYPSQSRCQWLVAIPKSLASGPLG